MTIHLQRRLYALILTLHPADFRNEFGREMTLGFEDAIHTFGAASLWRDALQSLARQWSAWILSGTPNSASPHRPSLLTGGYVMVRDEPFTPLELGRGLIGSVAMLSLCLYGLGGAARAVADPPIAYETSGTPAAHGNTDEGVPPLPPSNADLSHVRDAAFVRIASVSTVRPAATLVLGEVAQAQPRPELLLFHHAGPPISYEVATIKLLNPDAAGNMVKLQPGTSLNPLSIRRYITDAYGAMYAAQIVGGPGWLNKDSYLIRGKVPDDLEAALQKLTRQERLEQNRAMQQSLLAGRFQFIAHFETRILPVYELVPAKSGLKIAAVPAPPEHKPGDQPAPPRPGGVLTPGSSITRFNSEGLRVLNGRAIQMELLARILASDAGDRPIVNHTGFTGYFDIKDLTWAPLGDATANNAPDAPSLTVALERALGIRLVATKAPSRCSSSIASRGLPGTDETQIYKGLCYSERLSMRRRIALKVLIFLLAAGFNPFGDASLFPLHAQILHATGPLPSFEVATIKPFVQWRVPLPPPPPPSPASNANRGPAKIAPGNGGGITTNIFHTILPTQLLIALAYNVPFGFETKRIFGAPAWLNTDTYELQGKIDDSLFAAMQKMTPVQEREQINLMEQSLLADRFKLKVHFETREMAGYELVVAKGGAKLAPAKDNGNARLSMSNTPQGNNMTGISTSIDQLIHSPFLNSRTIVDKTGLTDIYDFILTWAPEQMDASASAPESSSDAPSLFTAIQEQLGLRLVPASVPVEVIVIDHVEKPSQN